MIPLLAFTDRIILEATEFLEPTINNIYAWFKNNGLVANSGKSHFWLVRMRKLV